MKKLYLKSITNNFIHIIFSFDHLLRLYKRSLILIQKFQCVLCTDPMCVGITVSVKNSIYVMDTFWDFEVFNESFLKSLKT